MQTVAYAASRALTSARPELFPAPKTYAPDPVWKSSFPTTPEQDRRLFRPITKAQRLEMWRAALRMNDTRTRACRTGGGRAGGSRDAVRPVLNEAALKVLRVLLFDFLNMRTGRLDPSYEGLAMKAALGRATVGRALATLRSLGILNWIRRCSTSMEDGRFHMKQERNAYAVLPPTGWRGFVARAVHKVLAHEWTPAPVVLSPLEQAKVDEQDVGIVAAYTRALAHAEPGSLEATLAKLRLAMEAKNGRSV